MTKRWEAASQKCLPKLSNFCWIDCSKHRTRPATKPPGGEPGGDWNNILANQAIQTIWFFENTNSRFLFSVRPRVRGDRIPPGCASNRFYSGVAWWINASHPRGDLPTIPQRRAGSFHAVARSTRAKAGLVGMSISPEVGRLSKRFVGLCQRLAQIGHATIGWLRI